MRCRQFHVLDLHETHSDQRLLKRLLRTINATMPTLEEGDHDDQQIISSGINGNHTNGNGETNGESEPFNIPLNNDYAYTPRKLRVFTIGAGYSGLLMAHKFQHRFPEMQAYVEHTILERHQQMGGTWLVNTYPGVQCDVPSHIYVSVSRNGQLR